MSPLPPSAFNDCPGLFRDEIETWINEGELPTGIPMLQAMLHGNLKQTFRLSTRDKLNLVIPLVRFLERACPDCWGSSRAVAEWVHVGGLYGKAKIADEYNESVNKKEPK
jgi:hypothetical protein